MRIRRGNHHSKGGGQARAKLFSARFILLARRPYELQIEGEKHSDDLCILFWQRKSPIDRSNKIVISMQYKEYTIDATMCGNVARMLNHNCEPNVTTLEVAVVRDPALSGDAARVPKLPRVGFFATRDIEANEELCIDYSPGRRGDDLQEVMECFCGSRKCKGLLF